MKNINVLYEGVGGFDNGFYSVSMYSMPRQELKFLHYHEVLELGVCLEGEGICYTDRGEIPYCAGDVQLIPPFCPHYDIALKDNALWMFISIDVSAMSSLRVSLDRAYFIELSQKLDTCRVFSKDEAVHRNISEIAELFLREASESTRLADLLVLKTAELLERLAFDKRENDSVSVDYKKNKSILPALNYVSASLKNGVRPLTRLMAESCYMSESYFRKIFTCATGESPKSYITRMQIQAAVSLLASTDLTIPEIYTQCGFDDNSTFYRCFMRIYKTSPGEYRKKCKTARP